jgi:hypothetical protein
MVIFPFSNGETDEVVNLAHSETLPALHSSSLAINGICPYRGR